MKFQTAYKETVKPVVDCSNDDVITEQHHTEDCQINNIIAKYNKTGAWEHRDEFRGEYGFATGQTLQDALDIVLKANDMFSELPAEIRQKFNHDPAQFLDYVQKPENAGDLVNMGLATSPEDIPSQIEQLVEYTIQKIEAKPLKTPKKAVKKEPSGEGDPT